MCPRQVILLHVKTTEIVHFFLITFIIIIFFMGNGSLLQSKGGWSLSKSSLTGMSMIGILVDDANGDELI